MHLMIDLETLGLEIDAPWLQMGWALFDPAATLIQSSGVWHVHPGERIEMTFDTLLWWFRQDEVARAAVFTSVSVLDRMSLTAALTRLEVIVKNEDVEGVWSHGATFDIPMIEYWCRRSDVRVPWGHRVPRDTRTILWLAGMSSDDVKSTVKHSAEADAIAQALAVQEAYRRIMKR